MPAKKHPITVSGRAYVWAPEGEMFLIPSPLDFPRAVLRALAEGHEVVRFRDCPIPLRGVMIGKAGLDDDHPIYRTNLAGIGSPVAVGYAVAAEGRFPGLPARFGLFGPTAKNQRYVVAFGTDDLEAWRRRLNISRFFREGSGVVRFTNRGNRAKVRRGFFEARVEAEKKWR